MRGARLGFGSGHFGGIAAVLGLRLVNLLLRDRILVHALIAGAVASRVAGFNFRLMHLRIGLTGIGCRDLGLCARLRQLGFGICQLAQRLIQLDLIITRIDFKQRLTGVHDLVVIDQQLDHATADLRRDLAAAPVDKGIVGGNMAARLQPPINAAAQQQDNDDDQHEHQHGTFVEWLFFIFFFLLSLPWS